MLTLWDHEPVSFRRASVLFDRHVGALPDVLRTLY